MNKTESERDLIQKRRSSHWNPNVYAPLTEEEDDQDEFRSKIKALLNEEDDEEDTPESSTECAEVGCSGSESETPTDGGLQQAEERYKEIDEHGLLEDSCDTGSSDDEGEATEGAGEAAEAGAAEATEEAAIEIRTEARAEVPVEERKESSGFIIEIISDSDVTETAAPVPEAPAIKKKQVFSEDEITVTEWKDKKIANEAGESGKKILKSRYLTAVPVGLINEKTEAIAPAEEICSAEPLFDDSEFEITVPPEEPIKEIQDEQEEIQDAPEAGSDEDLDYNDVFQNDPKILKRRKIRRKITGFIGHALKDIVTILLIFAFSVLFVASFNVLFRRQNEVYGSSMEPTYVSGDRVYSGYYEYLVGEPEIGDIVIIDISAFEAGTKPTFFYMLKDVLKNNKLTQFLTKEETSQDTYWIKRVVGVAGDEIEFKDGQFYRNGEAVYEEYLKEQNVSTYPTSDTTIVVPEGYVFVMGDNRNVSHDSRAVGCIPVEYLIGKCK